ncbi:MAG: ATP-binding cassette domain-containing protein [Herbaspirillum sp.]
MNHNTSKITELPCQLELRNLGYAYGLKTVLEDINLTLQAGQVLALVGASGCGKTTLLHLCAGLLTRQTGTLENNFINPAMMFQQPRLLPWKTVKDNIELGLKAQGMVRPESTRLVHATAVAVGLDDYALNQFPQALSGGMQSRVALARALVLEPDLLLLDEPFSALDIGLKRQMHRLLLAHQAERGTAVLMITHDLMEAVQLADTVLVMAPDPGRIVYRFSLDTPARARSEADVYRLTAEFLQVPVVRQSFSLEAQENLQMGEQVKIALAESPTSNLVQRA